MGEARQRGSYEQRKAEAVILQREQKEVRQKRALERELSKTPIQRSKERRAQMLIATVLGMGMGVGRSSKH